MKKSWKTRSMKLRTALPFLVLAGITLFSVEALGQQQGRLNERFRQLDSDGDGKLSQSEAGQLPFFTAADKDEDRFVTFRELVDHLRNRMNEGGEEADGTGSRVLPATAPLAARAAGAAAYSESHGGTAVVVLHGGDGVFERYAGEANAETTHHLHSGTKGFWGPVVASMIEDGLISSFDELAADTLTEWKDHPRNKTITLRQLLQLNAGLAQDLVNLQGHDRPTLADDLYEHAVGLACWFQPGERFAYGPSCYYALGAVLERKLAEREQTPLDYLKERILDPIGVAHGKWVHDASGNPHIPNGAWLTARDWARFGQFLLQEGTWEGEEIVPAELMRELREPSEANPGHGLALWLNRPGGFPPARQRFEPDPAAAGGFLYPEGEPDLYAALGAGKNRLYIIPSRNLVVARQTPKDTTNFEDSEFLWRLLGRPAPTNADLGPKPIWTTPEMRGPRTSYHTFASETAATEVSYHLYTPAAHEADPERRFPVLYWLHGGGEKGWLSVPAVSRYFDERIEAGEVPPMFIVFVNGLVKGMYCDWKDGSVKLETIIIEELLPHIDATHRTIASGDGRLIEGFSMGGYGAGRLGFEYPELFAGVSLLGAGPLQPRLEQTPRVGIRGREVILSTIFGDDQDYYYVQSPWHLAEAGAGKLREGGQRIRQALGDRDETFGFNRDFHEHLEGLGIPHEWIVLPGLGHDAMAVLEALRETDPNFYREALDPAGP